MDRHSDLSGRGADTYQNQVIAPPLKKVPIIEEEGGGGIKKFPFNLTHMQYKFGSGYCFSLNL